ncbi:MAG: hypothetical protein WCI81_07710 [Chlorobiaceae bacterium]
MNNKNNSQKLKTIAACLSVLCLCVIPDAHAREGVGLGIIVGEPTGLSMKYWLDDTTAIDAAVAFSSSDNNPLQFHADYLMHSGITARNSRTLQSYYGVGARISNDDNDTRLGIRVPFGVTYNFSKVPVDLFAEIAPVLDVTPDVTLDLNAAVGIRYFFH